MSLGIGAYKVGGDGQCSYMQCHIIIWNTTLYCTQFCQSVLTASSCVALSK